MKSEKKRSFIPFLAVLLIVAVLGVVGYMLATRLFVLDNIEVEGNEVYSEDQIKEILLSDENSWSTLYLFFSYNYGGKKEIPFIDTMEMSFVDPHTIHVKVYEKGILGYLYIQSVGQYAYFDKDGFVTEISGSEIKGVPEVDGIDVGSVVVYEKLSIDDDSMLSDLLLLAGLLKKYGISVKKISFDGHEMTLYIKKIQVKLGTGDELTEKIRRLQKILPKIKKKKGVLHMENWTPQTTDIIFGPN